MIHLLEMSELENLSLAGIKVDAEGLKQLKSLSRLRYLDVTDTSVANVRDLAQFMPAIKVTVRWR